MKLIEIKLTNFLLGLIGDTDALMESPLSPDDENLVESFDEDVMALDAAHHEIPTNKKHLLAREDVSKQENPGKRKESIEKKDDESCKYFNISQF